MRSILVFTLIISIWPMDSNAQDQSILHSIIQAHQVKVWKAEQLSQLLLKQGAKSVKWSLDLWALGYEVKLEVIQPNKEVMEVYLESRLPSESEKIYVRPQTRQAQITKLYNSIITTKSPRPQEWFKYFDSQKQNLEIASKILETCNKNQTTKLSLKTRSIKINYTNWRNARSIKHKKNYHMLKLDFEIADVLPAQTHHRKAIQFGKHMKVTLSDRSSKQNRREGTRILEKIQELHRQYK